MSDPNWMVDNAEKIGIVGHLMFDVVAFLQGWIVSGKAHDEEVAGLRAEIATLRTSLAEANTRDRQRLERAEALLGSLGNGRGQS